VRYPGLSIHQGRPEKYERPHIRYTDPATGRRKVEQLPALEEPALHRWLLQRSAALLAARAEPAAPDIALGVLVEKYLLERHRLRDSTLQQYTYSLAKFEGFLKDRPITAPLLRQFRAHVDQRGRAVASVNRDLAHVSAFLNHCRAAGEVALTRDQITDGLKRLPSDHEKQEALTRAELRELVCTVEGAGTYRAFVLVLLLTGMRASECLHLRPDHIRDGRIFLARADTKTKRGRVIDLSVSPSVCLLLKDFAGWSLSEHQARYYREKLHAWATFQRLRVTCGTYLTCAPGIYGGASAYMSAARLGHSVAIAEKHYVGVVQVDPAARTLEAAMGIQDPGQGLDNSETEQV